MPLGLAQQHVPNQRAVELVWFGVPWKTVKSSRSRIDLGPGAVSVPHAWVLAKGAGGAGPRFP